MKIVLNYIESEMILDALKDKLKQLDSQKQLLKGFKLKEFDFLNYEIEAHNDLVKKIKGEFN